MKSRPAWGSSPACSLEGLGVSNSCSAARGSFQSTSPSSVGEDWESWDVEFVSERQGSASGKDSGI